MSTGTLIWSAPPVVLVLSVLLGMVTLGFAWRRTGGERRGLEMAFLVLVVVAVVLAAAGPVWVVEGKRREKPRLVVLVDDSRSMGVLENGVSRSIQVDEALAVLGEEHVIERFTFSSALQAGALPAFRESDTDLGAALQQIRERWVWIAVALVMGVSFFSAWECADMPWGPKNAAWTCRMIFGPAYSF